MSGDFETDPEWKAWKAHVHADLIPKLENSGAVVSLVPEGEPDVKFAVELGLSIMLDKPIVAVVRPGTRVPSKLTLVADHIIEGDVTTRMGQKRLSATLMNLLQSGDNNEEDG